MSELLEKPIDQTVNAPDGLIDPFGRRITYLRVSVTDRCDLRCTYCMPERMKFLPRREVLSLEELEQLILAFVRRGVRKVRLTGGEPLLRKGILTLINRLGEQVTDGALDELTLTTNATQLKEHAQGLFDAGIRRVNVSLDTLDPDKFERITRRRVLDQVIAGIESAQRAGLRVKINTVAMKNVNAAEIPAMIAWSHARNIDISLIEVMPMGEIEEDRMDQYLPLTEVRGDLERRWTLTPTDFKTGGPSRYARVEETGGLIGFISPLTNNFCEGCNRVRLTCTGKLYMCLGQNDDADFRSVLRSGATNKTLDDAINAAIARKPKAHDFAINERGTAPAVARRMSVTGG